jgi:hypothetical protein
MPNSVWPRREDAPVIGDEPLAALLAGAELPYGSGPELRSIAEALAGLRGQAASDELAGEAEALAAFRNQFGAPCTAHWHRARQSSPWFRRLPVRAAAAATVTVLGLGGLATASYAGALPASMQRFAHDIIGAPDPDTRPVMSPSWAGPASARRPSYGLCVAWAHARAHGTRKQQATAFRELAAAAGGRDNVTAYCATAAHPGTSPPTRPQPDPTPGGHGKPTGLPSAGDHGKPSGLPSPHGHGKPTGLPTPHGTGKPTGLPTPHATGKPSALPTPHSTGR